ncbi:Thioredoxin [compost metagenome]
MKTSSFKKGKIDVELLKFYQDNCAPCKSVDSYLKSLDVKYSSINVYENPDKASEYGIISIPVVILLNDEGIEVKRSIGFKPEEIKQMTANL